MDGARVGGAVLLKGSSAVTVKLKGLPVMAVLGADTRNGWRPRD